MLALGLAFVAGVAWFLRRGRAVRRAWARASFVVRRAGHVVVRLVDECFRLPARTPRRPGLHARSPPRADRRTASAKSLRYFLNAIDPSVSRIRGHGEESRPYWVNGVAPSVPRIRAWVADGPSGDMTTQRCRAGRHASSPAAGRHGRLTALRKASSPLTGTLPTTPLDHAWGVQEGELIARNAAPGARARQLDVSERRVLHLSGLDCENAGPHWLATSVDWQVFGHENAVGRGGRPAGTRWIGVTMEGSRTVPGDVLPVSQDQLTETRALGLRRPTGQPKGLAWLLSLSDVSDPLMDHGQRLLWR